MSDEALRSRIMGYLSFLYGAELSPSVLRGLEAVMGRGWKRDRPPPALSERSIMLLAYPDQLGDGDLPPLAALDSFLGRTCEGLLERLHLLPFCPRSAEEPLSAVDPFSVDPGLGDWSGIEALGRRFSLAHEVPLSHVSCGSELFRRHAAGDRSCAGSFLRCDPYADYSAAGASPDHPVLVSHPTSEGARWFWSTHGGDTVDLNYRDPAVLLMALQCLLLHASRGAGILSLRGAPYLWKTAGTPCAHLPEAHALLRLLRCCLDAVCPGVLLASDSDSSPDEDSAYFGGSEAECQLVRQWPLGLLAAHAVTSGDAAPLSAWAKGIRSPGPGNAYLNLTASHEPLRLRHASPWLDERALARLIRAAREHGGRGVERDVDGEPVPETLHISYLDLVTALGDPDAAAARKFLLSQSIQLAMPGVPVVYFHALFGSRNFFKGFEASGHPSALMRERPASDRILKSLGDPSTLRGKVFQGYRKLLSTRSREPSFHPDGPFRCRSPHRTVFAVERGPKGGTPDLLALHNVDSVAARVPLKGTCLEGRTEVRDILTDARLRAEGTVEVPPLSALWLKA